MMAATNKLLFVLIFAVGCRITLGGTTLREQIPWVPIESGLEFGISYETFSKANGSAFEAFAPENDSEERKKRVMVEELADGTFISYNFEEKGLVSAMWEDDQNISEERVRKIRETLIELHGSPTTMESAATDAQGIAKKIVMEQYAPSKDEVLQFTGTNERVQVYVADRVFYDAQDLSTIIPNYESIVANAKAIGLEPGEGESSVVDLVAEIRSAEDPDGRTSSSPDGDRPPTAPPTLEGSNKGNSEFSGETPSPPSGGGSGFAIGLVAGALALLAGVWFWLRRKSS